MDFAGFSDAQVIDCHVHMWMLKNNINETTLKNQGEALVEAINKGKLSGMYAFGKLGHPALYLKVKHPGLFYAGGYAPWTGETASFKVDWHTYIQALINLGYDGVGEMGSKPVIRSKHTPLDSKYYTGFWESCEADHFPVLCHIGDVEDFWHEELTPEWAKVRGWGYWKADYPHMEELWTEIENVLASHPKLKIVLCHMLFMSPNLERLDDFLRDYPNANLDLSLGVELMYNISRRRDDWKTLFMKYDDRFFWGTDLGMSITLPQHLARFWLLRNFIETSREFYTPAEADDLLTRYKEPYLGLDLPKTSYEKIYSGNFKRLWGSKPREVNVEAAVKASEHQGFNSIAEALKQKN
jgi:predicted TIM-barrel fold metal-dependent hydrolase